MVADGAGDAEVGHLDAAVGGDEHVAGLDVAVHDAVAVGEAEGGGDVGGDLRGAVGMHPAVVPQDLGQGVTLHVLHDDEVRAVGLAPVEHRHDVGVLQVGGRLGLAAEALDESCVGGQRREQHLDRHRPVEHLVACQVDLGHAAAPEPPVQLVAPVENDLPLLRRHVDLRLRDGGIRARVHASLLSTRVGVPRFLVGRDSRLFQCLPHHRCGDRRCHSATSLLAHARLSLNDDRHGHAGRLAGGSREADDPRVRAVGRRRSGRFRSCRRPRSPRGLRRAGWRCRPPPPRSSLGATARPFRPLMAVVHTSSVAIVSITSPWSSRTSRTTCGVMISPPLATAEATSAICSGVACTSFWPMADWAQRGSGAVVPSTSVGNDRLGRAAAGRSARPG